MSLAIVPVKRLSETKSRLFSNLPSPQRQGFALAMLQDVLGALLATPSLERVFVATPDEDVARAARDAGADALVRDDAGLNPALDAAAKALAEAEEPVLVVLGDVAGALPADVETLFDALREQGGRGAVLAGSSDGGTSALLRAPHDVIPATFGPESAKRHRDAASERGVPLRDVALPSLSIDLDLPDDIERFLQTDTGGTNTRAALRALGWGSQA
jgi:2-phospho-L-lactate guanylyltransferase